MNCKFFLQEKEADSASVFHYSMLKFHLSRGFLTIPFEVVRLRTRNLVTFPENLMLNEVTVTNFHN